MCQEEFQNDRNEQYKRGIQDERDAKLCAVRNFLSVAAVCLGLLIVAVLITRWIKDSAFQSAPSPEKMTKTSLKYYKKLPDKAQAAYEAVTKLNSAAKTGSKFDLFREDYTEAYTKFELFKKSEERKNLEAFEHYMDLAMKEFGEAASGSYGHAMIAEWHVGSVDFLLDPEKQEFYLKEFYKERYFKGKNDKVTKKEK